MLNSADSSGFNYTFIFALLFFTLTFIILMMDYFGTFTIKYMVDDEFKSVVIKEISKNITDEYSSDYIINFESTDRLNLENNIKNVFIESIKNNKNVNVTVTSLNINRPSDLTITCEFKGTYEYVPIIGEKKFSFQIPVQSRAKVIRFDEF